MTLRRARTHVVAVDTRRASYLMNLGAASEIGLEAEDVRGVLAAVAPIVGTARVVSATGNIARALGLAIELAELEDEARSKLEEVWRRWVRWQRPKMFSPGWSRSRSGRISGR